MLSASRTGSTAGTRLLVPYVRTFRLFPITVIWLFVSGFSAVSLDV